MGGVENPRTMLLDDRRWVRSLRIAQDPVQRGRRDGHPCLRFGDLELRGRLPWSSNGAFLGVAGLDGGEVPCIYKPARGERQLWDFPDGLYLREVAAFDVAAALGWHLVPETVLREDLP